MNNKYLKLAVVLLGLAIAPFVQAATDWNADEYDLYSGDFNGDSKGDLLYVAKDPAKASGIALSDGTAPNTPWQTWASNYLGIPWAGNQYNILVKDFNGDGRADLFLQRTVAGDHYLLLTDSNGKVSAISQVVANSALGLIWSADQHNLVAGDINNDGKADLFMQAISASGLNAVVYADSYGTFTAGTTQTWSDGYLGLNWSSQKANVFAGDFNGDHYADLLVQAKPKFVMIDYDVPFPVPTYPANANGVVYSQGGTSPFQLAGVQTWGRTSNGVDWSPLTNTLSVGDFNGDGRDDVLFQPKSSTGTSYLLAGNASGAAFPSSATTVSSNVSLASSSSNLVVGNFDGGTAVGLYIQTLTAGGTNYVANSVGATTTADTHDSTSATGVVPASAVGHTVGSFAVTNSGAAAYSIPIVVPPGVSGVQPSLAISYQSGGGNGWLGVGWNLSGFSQIDRCNKTIAQDGVVGGVTLTNTDLYCLNGNKLRLTSGAYGGADSTYQTELETFARIHASSTTAGNGPAYFTVEDKSGLIYEYGSTGDSRIESLNASASTTPRVWALNKASDRAGNTMTITYQEDGSPNGSFRPMQIDYTSNGNAGLASAYRVVFFWETRPDPSMGYAVGGTIQENYRLNRIETHYNDPSMSSWRLVRKYQLSYNTSSVSKLSRLAAVQECDRNGYCLSSTSISWQDGQTGLAAEQIAANIGALSANAIPMDMNGDGHTDVVYPCGSNWCFMQAAVGGYGGSVDTGIAHDNKYARALLIDYNADGKTDILVPNASNNWKVLVGSSSGFSGQDLTIPATAADGNAFVADVNGDGLQDLLYVQASGSVLTVSARTNSILDGLSTTVTQIASLSGKELMTNSFSTSSTNARAFQYADFNRDGITDFIINNVTILTIPHEPHPGQPNPPYDVYYRSDRTLLLSSGGTYINGGNIISYIQSANLSSVTTPVSSTYLWRVADVNGDGVADVIYPNIQSKWCVRFGTGTGLTNEIDTGIPYSSSQPKVQVTDWNNDGNADLLLADSAGNWKLALSTGNTSTPFIAQIDTGLSAANVVAPNIGDVDGDGQADLLYADSSNNWRYRLHNGASPDLVNGIADGFGNNVSLTYAPLTDSTVYTKGSGATYPEMDTQAPIQVVKQYSANDSIGGSYTINHTYSGARVHLKGRGYLGFALRTETDSRTGIQSITTFNQAFPYIGTASSVAVKQPNGKYISYVGNTYSDLAAGTTYNDRHYPYQINVTQTSYEVSANTAIDGAAVKSVTTALTDVDAYGNPGTVTTTTNDLTGSGQTFTAVTSNTFVNDASNWCLGFVTQQQVTATVPNAAPLAGNATPTRTLKFEKDSDASKCRVFRQTLEPNTSTQVVTTFDFDSLGHTKKTTMSATGIADRVAEVSYGPQGGYPVQFTNAVGEISYKTYDYALGVPLTATDPNGIQASWQYDGFGRKTRANAPDGTATTWALSSCNVVNGYCGDGLLRYKVTQQQLDGSASHNVVRTDAQFFDAFNRALYSQAQTFSGAYSMVKNIYNNKGQLEKRSVPYFLGFTPTYSTTYYDLLGRVVKMERPASEADTSLQTIEYTYAKLVESVKDPLTRVTTKTTNAIGQVIQMTDANNSSTQYQYDALGNLAKTTDSAGNQISSTFNLRGFKVASSDPDMGNWNYEYFASGELKKQTDAKNQVVEFTYDNISRPRTRTEPEGITTWNYGTSAAARNIGQLDYVCMGTGANCAGQTYREAYTYDSLGRPNNITYTQDTTYQVDYTYNNQGALDTLTYPTSTSGYRLKLQYAYTNGQLAQIRDYSVGTQFWTLNATNAANQAIDELMANGVRIISGYDGISGAISYRQSGNSGSTSNLQNLSYQWDKAGNLKQRQDITQNLTEVFNYDSLNRIDNSTRNGSQNLDVTVNAIGNLTKKDDFSGSTYDYTTTQAGCTYYAHAQPHAVRKIDTNVYCYDANGNMTSRQGSTIDWTSYNLPSQINSGSNYSQFSYGPSRQRWKQIANYSGTTETTIYVGGLIEKVTRSGVTEYKHYIAGGSATAIYTRRDNSTTSTYYVTSDHLGSADVITDGTGAAVVRESFAAYGARRGSNWTGSPTTADQAQFTATTRRGYTGHEMLDNLSLIHMNGRVYDPQIGRFISADPYIQAPLDQQSLNRYSYVSNGPMSATDPSGYFKLKDLLNPFSKNNPIGLRSSEGRAAFGFAAGLLPFADYNVLKANDKFYLRNPELQFVPKIVSGVVACYFPALWWLPSVVDAHFTRINGGEASDVLRSFVVGIATSYVSSTVNIHYGNSYTLGRVAVEGVVSGVSSELAGGDFWKGFEVGAGMGLLRFYYVKTMKYDVTWEEGHGLASEDGHYDEPLGVPKDKQVFGTNEKLNPNGKGNFWKQGGALSNAANRIPGMNSLARLHDYYQISFGDPSSWTRTLFNVPAMVPAAVVNYGALIQTLPNYPAVFQEHPTRNNQ